MIVEEKPTWREILSYFGLLSFFFTLLYFITVFVFDSVRYTNHFDWNTETWVEVPLNSNIPWFFSRVYFALALAYAILYRKKPEIRTILVGENDSRLYENNADPRLRPTV